jgi:hypothetical protein
MSGPLFFNIAEARRYLLAHEEVYTLRTERGTGRTSARVGARYENKTLFRVEVRFITAVKGPRDLYPYLRKSGFRKAAAWLAAAGPDARHLYHVRRVP